VSEKPILFSAPMVKAILAGTKVVTRRVVNPQPPCGCLYEINGAGAHALCRGDDGREAHAGSRWVPPTPKSRDHRLPCQYIGSLWVREAWKGWFGPKSGDGGDWLDWQSTPRAERTQENNRGLIYRATQDHPNVGRWVTPLFMPRWASRITLDVVSVLVERLHAITDEEALREGVLPLWTHDGDPVPWYTGDPRYASMQARTPRGAFERLWVAINGRESWESNPFVWRVEFARR